jgi:hypothetical protein
VNADLLSSSTPSRLLCRRGRWALELTRLVPVDNHVFQPRRQRLEGSEAILSHLKRSGDTGALIQGATQLMRSVRSDEERSFEAIDGEWVPSQSARATDVTQEATAAPPQDWESAFAELRAEFMILRASHQRLKQRVVALEAELAGAAVPAPRKEREERSRRAKPTSVAPEPAGAPSRALVEAEPEPQPFAQQIAAVQYGEQRTLTAGQEPPAAPGAVGPSPFGGVVPAPRKDEPEPVASINLSSDAQITAALAELFGSDPGYAPSREPLPDSALELAALYASLLVDDDGKEVGAVLADIRATANLGGLLSGLPPTVIEEQAKTGVLNDSVTSAMSEVCNTLGAILSEVAGNGQVRCTPLGAFPADRLRWVGEAKSYLCFEKRRGGCFWIVTR